MKTLLLMRHAKSDWDDAGTPDHDRPLNARGERTAPQMAALLVSEHVPPDLILSSTALRARATALAVAEATGWKPELCLRHELYLAAPSRIVQAIVRAPSGVDCLLVVGHNPGMEELVSDLATTRQSMPTAAVARFAIPVDDWAAFAGARAELVQVWRPRDVA
ncbi:MAG: histidine phosphatase family protein [Myxococcales bacterium]|nr:histidine phosphatase family protein [Myxococcales bacterium]